jgi:hypothetical protein
MNKFKFDGNNVSNCIHLICLDMDHLYWEVKHDSKDCRMYHDLGFLLNYGIILLENNIKIWSWKWLSENGKLCEYVYSFDFLFYDQITEAGCKIDDYQIRMKNGKEKEKRFNDR